ncbi:hypothetical protein [Neomegalonema sp.]|uniref:hypothetical protein n=1 Tax=Neomegalonema sp. TaxID=2039713 RepID=UPI0026265946|nr:hypothetical protein [Neomegalonema sp.]MDD2868162.1 hypothetical protein [Neomegalonema sp.]
MSNLRTTGPSSGLPSTRSSAVSGTGGVRSPRRPPSAANLQQAEAERLRRSAQTTARSVETSGAVSEGAVFDPPPVDEALATFLAAPAGGMRVVDPAATIALTDAAGDLAASADPVDRYAAVVVETHLAARRELSRQINALLKA